MGRVGSLEFSRHLALTQTTLFSLLICFFPDRVPIFLHVYFAFVPQMLFVGLFLPIYISLRCSVHGHVVNYLVSDLLALFVHFLLFSGHFIPPLFLGIIAVIFRGYRLGYRLGYRFGYSCGLVLFIVVDFLTVRTFSGSSGKLPVP
jgi:hypothetical protein